MNSQQTQLNFSENKTAVSPAVPGNTKPEPLTLHGCMAEPLMSYLKALGIFRLVSEQVDPTCRAAWKNGKFMIQTTLNEDGLVEFFYRKYHPTPIAVPWSGSDFFNVNPSKKLVKHKKTPSGSGIIEAFIENTSPRLESYRESLGVCLEALKNIGITEKKKMENRRNKSQFLSCLLTLGISNLDAWLDAAFALPNDQLKLNTLLGSGGGSDGNTHFSDNFMQNLWDSLPDFDEQKNFSGNDLAYQANESNERLRTALFDSKTISLVEKRTSSLYDSGAVGGPNAGQGFERDSLTNPWNFILAIEGCVMLAGAVSRKLGASNSHAVFPFQTNVSATYNDSLSNKENAGQEIWLPLWHRFCGISEIKILLSEGRSDWNGKQAKRGVDFTKAVASLGVDRGIDSFTRYAIIKGRVGGDNYNTAAFLGHFEVKSQSNVNLLSEADHSIERYRRACGEKTPARFGTALRRLDTAVFDYCRFGGKERFQAILIAIGQAEREVAFGPKFRENKSLQPLQALSAEWVVAADDNSDEFEIAAALAGIQGIENYPGIRANMEPVDFEGHLDWKDESAKVVWKRGNLAENLCAVLERRLLDWKRLCLPYVPIYSNRYVSPATIAKFIHGELDDDRIECLLWGLICCKIDWKPCHGSLESVPRAYALLKTCFPSINPERQHPNGVTRNFWEKASAIRPEPRIVHLVRANRSEEALTIAAQRLRSSGLTPVAIQWKSETFSFDAIRLAAALLFPVKATSLENLWNLVRCKTRNETAEKIDTA